MTTIGQYFGTNILDKQLKQKKMLDRPKWADEKRVDRSGLLFF